METIIKIRNFIIGFVYRAFLKPIFFMQDPETVHDRITALGNFFGRDAVGRILVKTLFNYQNPILSQTIAGINFKNPLGLAAGFDKEALLTEILPAVGFGFEEIGSITGRPCAGNPKPRLWRLKSSNSLVVYYGLKNGGCEKIVERLKDLKLKIPTGVSIAKTNSPETVSEESGIADYVKAYQCFINAGIGDYFTVNISCPNAFGGEPFTTPEKLDRLLNAITRIPSNKPLFIKMPAEMPLEDLDSMAEIACKYKITGFVSTNLAKDRSNGNIKDKNVPDQGGLSGKVVQEQSDRQIAYLYKRTQGEFVIIGCGGVFTAEDAYRKIKLGASLIQLITGMIFQGPQAISSINQGLAELLKRDGYKNIAEAVGTDNK